MVIGFIYQIIFDIFIIWLALLTFSSFSRVIDNLKRNSKRKKYDERLGELTTEMVKASEELDAILQEMTKVISDRRKVLEELDKALINKETDKISIESAIEELKKIQNALPVVQQMTSTLDQAQEKRARKDARTALFQNVLFFLVGLLASIPVNIISSVIQTSLGISLGGG